MLFKRATIYFSILACCLLAIGVVFWPGVGVQQIQEQEFEENEVGPAGVSSQAEKQEYKQERARIKALRKSFKPGLVNDLKEYEKFANEIQNKWNKKSKENYARLMLEVCGPLNSRYFNDDRRKAHLAREYALSVLETPDAIPLEIELKLTGYVMSDMCTPYAPKGEDLAQRRKKDVQIRVHAWKRLLDAIDPNWDPNDKPFRNVAPPTETGLRHGTSPKVIKNQEMRAIYEKAIERNRLKSVRYLEQSRLRDWLKRFPKRAEAYIIQAYSKPPFNLEELKQYLEKYIADRKTRARIIDTVTKNMEKQTQKEPGMQ